jgi:hypothetical protein
MQHLQVHDTSVAPQVVKKKVKEEDGRGRFKTTKDGPQRISDREKRPALKT